MLPKPLYESLPLVYVAAGIATLMTLNSRIAAFSAVLFLAAGLRIWAERSVYRRGAGTRRVSRRPGTGQRPIAQ